MHVQRAAIDTLPHTDVLKKGGVEIPKKYKMLCERAEM